MPDPVLIDLLQRLALAFGVGFLIGIERGWKHREAPEGTRAAGLRTHAVIGLLGGVCGALLPYVGQIGFAALTLAFAAALLAFKLRESEQDNDISVTGTIAALLVFALGAYAMWGNMVVAGAAAVVLAGVLAFKDALHSWLDKLTWKELRSALLILAATVIALPLLPDRTVDIWHAINPRELWLLTILVAGASFAGYVAVRVLGPDVGLMAGSAAGALVSSTVVTAELGRRVRNSDAPAAAGAAAAALAAAVSIIRVIILAGVAATAALGEVIAPLVVAAAAFAAAAAALRLLNRDASPGRDHKLESPLDVLRVAQFALLLGGLIVVGRIVGDQYGQAGILPLAATVGLGDVDSVTLASGSLMRGGLAASIGAHAILIAVLMNTLAKAAIGLLSGGWQYALYYCAAAVAAAALGAAAWFLAAPVIAPMFR
jgi:uncharacterized membrane protein (DUF4010 family)